ncbi:MAG: stage III sporulation protein AB [Peptococcaceae bacterium BICA1-7]|nr:MAG: stage III sporulation protein AB [Peptococcaceae bacterium BICA1-7]HBV96830.1 stage III sporulation protein AB [Desulfotomaculum sp.]
MYKLIGAVVLVAAGGAAGMLVARDYARRPVEIRSIITALQMLETEIIYSATPLGEAMDRVASATDGIVSGLFREASHSLLVGEGATAGEAWEKALVNFYRSSSLTVTDSAILKNLGRALGRSGREDQEKHLKLACEQLKRELSRAEEAAAKNTRMWNYLGFCGALAAVIILY